MCEKFWYLPHRHHSNSNRESNFSTQYTHLMQWEGWQIPCRHVPRAGFTLWLPPWFPEVTFSSPHLLHERMRSSAWGTVGPLSEHWHSFRCQLCSLPSPHSEFSGARIWHSFTLFFDSFITKKLLLKPKEIMSKLVLPGWTI